MSLELIYTSTKTVPVVSATQSFFIPHWDAWLVLVGGMKKIFRDGTAFDLGITVANSAYMAMNESRVCRGNYFDSNIYELDLFTSMPKFDTVLNDVPWTWQKQAPGDFVDDVKRILFNKYNGGYIAKVYSLVDGSLLRTQNLGADAGTTYSYFYAGRNRFGGYSPANGKMFIYDYESWTLVGKWTVPTGKSFSYDSTYNVFFLITQDSHIQLYSTTDIGTNLAAPTFTPVGNKYKGAGYKLTTRLTGSSGNPIPYKQIEWTLTNGKGWLETVYSITDENGYAYNYYWCPITGELGSETISLKAYI